MIHDITKISTLVEEQFSEFYRDEGPNFIAFVRSFYEWLELEGNLLHSVNSLQDNLDIDTTVSEYLLHFKSAYMANLPDNILGNQRLLQKHILDLYRSKGSPEAIRLLFRLYFNEDIDLYIPSSDILRTSDGNWISRQYIEVSDSLSNADIVGKDVIGSSTGAIAFCTDYEQRTVENKVIHVLFVENVRGSFRVGELLTATGIESALFPYIRGSIAAIDVYSSDSLFEIGDTVISKTNPTRGTELKVYGLQTSGETEVIPNLIYGGTGYSINANVSITAGSNTAGSGLAFTVGSITNTMDYIILDMPLAPYANVKLNVADYGMNANVNNISSTLASSLNPQTLTVGTVGSLYVTSTGSGYDGTVNSKITERAMLVYNIVDPNGGIAGNNAIVITEPSYGIDVIRQLTVTNSGFGNYIDGQIFEGWIEGDILKQFSGVIRLSALGTEKGYFIGNNGFLNSTKYIQDNYYYQEFSYEVQSTRALETYSDILRKIAHPSGNEMFGRIAISKSLDLDLSVTGLSISHTL